MANDRANQRSNGASANMIKGGLAAVVIIACVSWVLYSTLSGGPTVIQATNDPALASWLKSAQAKQAELYQQMEKMTVTLSPDGKGALVTGSARSAAELAKVKTAFESIEPKVTIAWDVKIGG